MKKAVVMGASGHIGLYATLIWSIWIMRYMRFCEASRAFITILQGEIHLRQLMFPFAKEISLLTIGG